MRKRITVVIILALLSTNPCFAFDVKRYAGPNQFAHDVNEAKEHFLMLQSPIVHESHRQQIVRHFSEPLFKRLDFIVDIVSLMPDDERPLGDEAIHSLRNEINLRIRATLTKCGIAEIKEPNAVEPYLSVQIVIDNAYIARDKTVCLITVESKLKAIVLESVNKQKISATLWNYMWSEVIPPGYSTDMIKKDVLNQVRWQLDSFARQQYGICCTRAAIVELKEEGQLPNYLLGVNLPDTSD